MKTLNIIIASQDYESANHKKLWNILPDYLFGEVLILDIPADHIISRIKRKKFRIQESTMGKRNIKDRLSIIRPLFLVRPEILNKVYNKAILKSFFTQIKKYYNDIECYKINIIAYDGKWIEILSNATQDINFYYYIYDELSINSNCGTVDKKSKKIDTIGCEKSKFIFAMSEKIADSRSQYSNKIAVVGNGADFVGVPNKSLKLNHSVAFIGNFRNWIDIKLFEGLINYRPDLTFGIVGPIQNDMKEAFSRLLNSNKNVIYLGNVKKEEVYHYYSMFNAVIVPYKQNDFMYATRPIKIVESVFAGTPVVTVPVSGYKENNFIRYATDINSFSKEIDFLINNPIEYDSSEYISFIEENSWKSVAIKISNKINEDKAIFS